jgi:hypothetical protein
MAMNVWLVPTGSLKVLGETVIEVSVGAVTVSEALPLSDPEAAAMVTVPGLSALATPPLLMVAKAVFDELQLTLLVKFRLLPSL